VGEERLNRLRVVQRTVHAAAVGRADGHRQRHRSVRAIAHARRLGQDLVEGGEDEVGELDLRHRPDAVDGHPDRRADDQRLGQRRVKHAVATELVVEPVGGKEDAALLAHVLTQHDDRVIAPHLLGQR
jgi:hypothetical protein